MFSFVQITDHHLRDAEDVLVRGFSPAHALRRTLRHIAEHRSGIDFLVSTGDLVEIGTDAEYQCARGLLGITTLAPVPGPLRMTAEGLRDRPLYVLPGNHDPRAPFFRNLFAAPSPAFLNTTFVHKGVRFVCLDWGPDNKAVPSPGMFEFLTQQLADNAPTILLMHHAVVPMGIARIDALIADDVARFADIVRGRNVMAMFCGHTHATYDGRLADIPVYGLRSTSYSFALAGDEFVRVLRSPHYRVVTVDTRGPTPNLTTEIVDVEI